MSGVFRYLKNSSTLTIEESKCVGCGRCTVVCPHQILEVQDKKIAVTDKDLCMECGACMTNCPFDAISVEKGVGCFSALVMGLITGKEPSCDCSGGKGGCC